MTKSERNRIITWASDLTDEQLEKEYYDAVYSTLGSQAEEMYERGWEISDIIEREKYEKWLGERADLLEMICIQRGIELWKDHPTEKGRRGEMKWKEFLEIEDCDLCPIKKAELCGGGASCYGSSPIDPPCCYFEDDTDLDEWIKEAYERRRRYEEYQDKLIREKKAKEEKAKKAADTRHKMRVYCMAEIVEIKTLEKRLKAYEKELSFARSLAFAINHTNEMFKYPERLTEKPEAQKTIDELKNQIEVAKEKYKAKRKEFYANRKQDHPTEKGGVADA